MTARIQKWGNSQGLRLTKHLLEDAHLHIGDEVEIIASEQQIIIKPIKKAKSHFDIKQLVKAVPDNYTAHEEIETSVGKEAW